MAQKLEQRKNKVPAHWSATLGFPSLKAPQPAWRPALFPAQPTAQRPWAVAHVSRRSRWNSPRSNFAYHGGERSVTKGLTIQTLPQYDVAGTANHTLIALDTGNVAEVRSALWATIH